MAGDTAEKRYTVREFLENVPPGRAALIDDLAVQKGSYIGDNDLVQPEITLHCENDACKGFRLFESTARHQVVSEHVTNLFVIYRCKNCGETTKTYALGCYLNKDRSTGILSKFGELPAFGPPTPTKVITLLGKEKDYYFKGRRSENQGLGIAAFAYYRRVVENQKDRIFDGIIQTVQKVDSGNTALLAELEAAKRETQFTKAVDTIKHGIPQALLIDGHNPLTLLHSALSEGLHAGTDEECLEYATSIRVVLFELVDRMSSAVKNSQELKSALFRILQRKKPAKSGPGESDSEISKN